MSTSKPQSTPISSAKLSPSSGILFANPTLYRQIVGSLQYLSLTRPDISFAVNKVCQFMHKPTDTHWAAVKRILRYLQGTMSHGLFFSASATHTLHAFTDADWAGDINDRKSTAGNAIFLGCNLISWVSRKQRTVARSSTESEYKAIADAAADLKWFFSLLQELRLPLHQPPVLWCDNLGASYLASNPVFHARTKHIEIDYHFVREMVAAKQISIHFVSSKDNVADALTKPLPPSCFSFNRSKLKVFPRIPFGLRGTINTS